MSALLSVQFFLWRQGYLQRSLHHMHDIAADVQDPPEYYDPPGGLLAYQPQLGNLVNESVIKGDGMELDDYRGHFNLVNAQLTQVCPIPSSLPCKLCQHPLPSAVNLFPQACVIPGYYLSMSSVMRPLQSKMRECTWTLVSCLRPYALKGIALCDDADKAHVLM